MSELAETGTAGQGSGAQLVTRTQQMKRKGRKGQLLTPGKTALRRKEGRPQFASGPAGNCFHTPQELSCPSSGQVGPGSTQLAPHAPPAVGDGRTGLFLAPWW